MEPYNQVEKRVCTKKREGILTVKKRKKKDADICRGPVVKRIHSTIKITSNLTSLLCGKNKWKKENGTGLPTYQSMDSKE